MLKRMWINQPSKFQPLHKENGTNVLMEDGKDNMVKIYYIEGNTISALIPRICLSNGWLEKYGNLDKYAGLTLEEIAITHKDNELVKALVKKIVEQKKEIKELEKHVDLLTTNY